MVTSVQDTRQVAEAYLSGRDVLMSAPTGSNKSFTFEIAPYGFDFLSSDCHTAVEDAGSVCLVVVPLLALKNDQVVSLRARGLSATCVGSECDQGTLQDTRRKIQDCFRNS